MSESVSFRISRTAEDLAQTVAALSRRLVSLEQRLGALELQGSSLQAQLRVAPEVDPAELACLDSVDQLLADCRSLLAETELPISELPVPQPDAAEASLTAVESDEDWDGLEELDDPELELLGLEAAGVDPGRPGEETLTAVAG